MVDDTLNTPGRNFYFFICHLPLHKTFIRNLTFHKTADGACRLASERTNCSESSDFERICDYLHMTFEIPRPLFDPKLLFFSKGMIKKLEKTCPISWFRKCSKAVAGLPENFTPWNSWFWSKIIDFKQPREQRGLSYGFNVHLDEKMKT